MTEGTSMENDKILDLLIELKTIVAGISTQLESTKDSLQKTNEILMNHEHRITQVEGRTEGAAKEGLKDQLLQWLAKGLLAAVITIGSLTGAAGLLKEILK